VSDFRFKTAQRVRPMEGLTSCGDAIVEVREGDWNLFAVIDALGHGPDAEKSAKAAVHAATQARGQALEQVFEAVHRSLPGLRGVVMSALLAQGDSLTFAGVGNVEIFSPEGVARPVSMAGTLGGASYRFRSFAFTLKAGQRWVMASDGIRAREASALLPKLNAEPAEVAAEQLMKSVTRPNDDASVLVLDVEMNA
jgi:negative regulator of sigma-B (phosphoserine phosphatase)